MTDTATDGAFLLDREAVLRRNNVRIVGNLYGPPIVFAHGFGCSQEMWDAVAPAFFADHAVVLFDLVGSGGSDLAAYDRSKYDSLEGYASDLLEVVRAVELGPVMFVGHSVSSMIGVIAANREPSLFSGLALVGPSPRYVDTDEYVGGFGQSDIDGLLDNLDANFTGWAGRIAPVMMGNDGRPELSDRLEASFCRTDPEISRHFARVTFLSDSREDLTQVTVPTLVLQCTDDVIAPEAVGRYVHEQIPGSRLVILQATGHLPHLSAPHEVIAALRDFVDRERA